MNRCFADTFYFLALLNRKEASRSGALEYSQREDLSLVTTWAVMIEVADALCISSKRAAAIELIQDMETSRRDELIPMSQEVVDRAFLLYRNRPDKEWSLTDCISFVTMEELGITDP